MPVTVLPSIRGKNEDTLREHLAFDVLNGLSDKEKSLPSKYFYDDIGSKIYENITDLDEYYLTKAEYDIFEIHKHRLADLFHTAPFNLIELGAGDGRKSKVLLKEFTKRGLQFTYSPIDISESAVDALTTSVEEEYGIRVEGMAGEYHEGIKCATALSSHRNIVLFLGANIGNFTPAQAQSFVRFVWHQLNHGDLVLIGFDLKKSINRLQAAYNDSRGITRAFNLNVLQRLNQELGAEFDTSKFNHHAFYNPRLGAMESHLISMCNQQVYIAALSKTFTFQAYEPIHLEYSFKYLEADIATLANANAYVVEETFYDSHKQFVDSLWRVVKKGPV